MNSTVSIRLEHIGRLLLASLFILGGIAKILVPDVYRQMMVPAGLTPVAVLLPLVIALELGGGFAIALDLKRIGPWAALVLAVHTLGTNVFLHRFWELEGQARQLELSAFFKNVSIIGGMLFYAATRFRRNGTDP